MGAQARIRCVVLWVLAILVWSGHAGAGAEPAASPLAYQIRASLSRSAPHVDGTVHVSFTNRSRRTLEEAIFLLFPNRFTLPDPGVNDFNRPYVYPEEEFDPGWMEILDARDGGRLAPVERVRHPNLPDGTVVRVRIARLPPGQTRTLTLRFRTF